MTIPLFGSTGALFNRVGRLGKAVSQLDSYQDSQLTNLTDTTTGVVAQYNAESDLQAIVGNGYIQQLNAAGGIGAMLQDLAARTVNRMVFRDFPLLNQTLQSQNLLGALQEVITQMKATGNTVLAMTVTGTPAAFTGTGDGVVNVSTKRPFDGLTLENSYTENVLLTVTSDSYNGSATAGNEPVAVTGTGGVQGSFSFDWPLGSNGQATVNAIDGNSDNASGNILTNSGFNEWTSNVPDNWTLVVGAGGVNITEETSIVYDGDASIKLTGDGGGTLTQIRQQFSDSSGTLGSLSPQTQYSVCLFLRRDGTPAGVGVLTVDLVDDSFTVINDENGVANSFTVDLTTLGVNFAASKGVFRTPAIMPDEAYIRLRLSTALTNGRSVYIDKLSMGVMTQLYTSGPYFAVHAGSVPFLIGDYATCQITNSRGAAGTLNTFQCLFARLLPLMYSSELLLPSSGSPTISDTLITS